MPRLDGREKPFPIVLPDSDITGSEPGCLVGTVAGREQLLFKFHTVATSCCAVQRDTFKARYKKLLAVVSIPINRTHTMNDSRDILRDDMTFPILLVVPK